MDVRKLTLRESVRYCSRLSFDEVLARLRARVGEATADNIVGLSGTREEFAEKVQQYVGDTIPPGLFLPVEFLLAESGDGASCNVTYVVPSSLIVVDANPQLLSAAQALDAKVEALVASAVTR
jgi:hypothetical protein